MLFRSDKFIHKAVCLPGKPNVALMSIAFRDNETVGIRTVSYTHLDVYKRQLQSLAEPSDRHILWHKHHYRLSLLYTLLYPLNLHPLWLRGGVMKAMDKLTTGVAYGTSAGSAGYWFLQLLDKMCIRDSSYSFTTIHWRPSFLTISIIPVELTHNTICI